MQHELEINIKIRRGPGTNAWLVDIGCGEAVNRQTYDSLGLLARDLQDSVAAVLIDGCVEVVQKMRRQIEMENLQKQFGAKEINPRPIKKESK